MINQLLFKTTNSPQLGALAGVLATIPMTAVMLASRKIQTGSARPILPEKVTSGVLRETGLRNKMNSTEKETLTWSSHFGFGAAAAAFYPFFKKTFKLNSPWTAGAAYGLAVWVANYWGLLPSLKLKALPTHSPARDNVMGVTSHLVWGVALAGAYQLLCSERIFGRSRTLH